MKKIFLNKKNVTYVRPQILTNTGCFSGTAIVTGTKAALWTDGRYFLQANAELDCNWILQREGQ